MSLIVTGTIGIDSVYTPHGQAEQVLGGSCTYFAAAASFYGPVRVVAAVGGDFGEGHWGTLKGFTNIDTRGVEVRAGSKTFRWGGKYAANMDSRETLFTELGVLLEAPPRVPGEFADSEVVFLANTHPGVQMNLLSQFPKRKLAVADTMDLWINTARGDLEKLMGAIDGLVLNYDEAELFTGKKNPVAAARQILREFGEMANSKGQMANSSGSGEGSRRGAEHAEKGRGGNLKFVVVKKGEHGCLFIHRDGIAALPAYPAERVIDPTGAGDTFAGGMMGFVAAEMAAGRVKDAAGFETVRKALVHGTVVASFNIESFTLSRLVGLRKEEVEGRLREFEGMVRW